MAKKPSVVICGNYGARNLGDEAVLAAILSEIRAYLPDTHIIVLSTDPPETQTTHQVEAWPLFPMGIRSFLRGIARGTILKTLAKILGAEVFILGGGTLFSDEKLIAVFIWSVQVFWAYWFGIPVYIYANGVGPLKSNIGRWLSKKMLGKATLMTVRDRNSAAEVEQLGIKNEVTVTADPVFALNKNLISLSNSNSVTNLSQPNQQINHEYVLVSLRNWPGFSENNMHEIAHFIDKLWQKYELGTILVSLQEYREKDSEVLNKVFNQVMNKKNVQVISNFANYEQLCRLILGSKVVIGMRLHSLIFAAILEKPFIAISYSQKVHDIISDLDQAEQLIDLSNLNESGLCEKLNYTFKNYDSIINMLKIKKVEQANRGVANIKKLVELMNNKVIH